MCNSSGPKKGTVTIKYKNSLIWSRKEKTEEQGNNLLNSISSSIHSCNNCCIIWF